jgi:hypothetical protein
MLVKDRWHNLATPNCSAVSANGGQNQPPRIGEADQHRWCQRWNMVTAAESAKFLGGELGNDTFLLLLPILRTLYGPSDTFPVPNTRQCGSVKLPITRKRLSAARAQLAIGLSQGSTAPFAAWASAISMGVR